MIVRVTAQGRPGPVTDAFVTLREAGGSHELRTLPCDPEASASVCRVVGGPGVYDFFAGAPGFERPRARVVVADTTAGACCPSVGTQEVNVRLDQIAPAMRPAAQA